MFITFPSCSCMLKFMRGVFYTLPSASESFRDLLRLDHFLYELPLWVGIRSEVWSILRCPTSPRITEMKGSDTDTELAVVHSLCCIVWIDKSHSASVRSSLFLCVGWNKEGKVWGCPRNVKLNQVSCRKAFRGEKNIYLNNKRGICQAVETIAKTQRRWLFAKRRVLFSFITNVNIYLRAYFQDQLWGSSELWD